MTPAHAAALSDDAPADYERLPETARAYGIVGHAQAAARARLDGRPRLNRRDFATVDGGIPGTHFVSLQRDLEDFNATRAVMNAADARRHHPSASDRRRGHRGRARGSRRSIAWRARSLDGNSFPRRSGSERAS